METKQVTAQDLFNAIVTSSYGSFGEDKEIIKSPTIEAFDALLSRARQESAEEMKSKLEEIYSECQRRDNERHKLALLKFGKESRREALKEMDEAYWDNGGDPDYEKIKKLTEEYKQTN